MSKWLFKEQVENIEEIKNIELAWKVKLNEGKYKGEIKLARMCTGMDNTGFLCASLRTIEHKLFYLIFNIFNYWYNIF